MTPSPPGRTPSPSSLFRRSSSQASLTLPFPVQRLSADEIVTLHYDAITQQVLFTDLHEALTDAPFGISDFSTAAMALRYVWILFSQRNWSKITEMATAVDPAGLTSEERGALSDLYMLAQYRQTMPHLMQGKGDSSEALNTYEAALNWCRNTLIEDDNRAALHAACLDCIRGAAAAGWARVAQLPATFTKHGVFRATDNMFPVDQIAISKAQWTFHSRDRDFTFLPHNRKASLLVSCNEAYFHTFGRIFVQNTLALPGDFGIHLHCIGFTPASHLEDLQVGGRVGYTIDNTDISEFNEDNKTAYFAGARYLFLEHYLDLYPQILVSDIDGCYQPALAEEFSRPQEILYTSQNFRQDIPFRRLWWEQISAASVLFRASPGTKRAAAHLSDYILTCLNENARDGRSAWYSDQLALCSMVTAFPDLKTAPFGAKKRLFTQDQNWRLFFGMADKVSHMEKT